MSKLQAEVYVSVARLGGRVNATSVDALRPNPSMSPRALLRRLKDHREELNLLISQLDDLAEGGDEDDL